MQCYLAFYNYYVNMASPTISYNQIRSNTKLICSGKIWIALGLIKKINKWTLALWQWCHGIYGEDIFSCEMEERAKSFTVNHSHSNYMLHIFSQLTDDFIYRTNEKILFNNFYVFNSFESYIKNIYQILKTSKKTQRK